MTPLQKRIAETPGILNMVEPQRVTDIETAERIAHFREAARNKAKPYLEKALRDNGQWIEAKSDNEWIDAAGRYIKFDTAYDHDGRRVVPNAMLSIQGTYHRAHISFTAENEYSRLEQDCEEVKGPFASTYGAATCITSHLSARSQTVEVTDGDVICIDCRDYRVRIYRRKYVALDRIERDGTLTPAGWSF